MSGFASTTLSHIGCGLVSLRQEPKAIVVIGLLPIQYEAESKSKNNKSDTLFKYLNKFSAIITLFKM